MMKSKRLLLTLLIALLVPWAANAQSLFTEDFEDGTMPTGWTTDGSGTWSVATAVNSTHPSSAGEGTYCAQIKHGTTGAATKLITPEIDLSSVNSAELSFMHVEQSWSGDIDGLKIYYRTSSSGTWTQLKEYTAAYANWTTESGIVLPNPSSTYQIAFEYIDNYGYGLGIDYVDIVPGASCPAPTGLALTPNGQSATLTWVSNESSFNVAYSTDGTANPDDLTYTTVNTTSYTKDNLAVDTDHYFWVRANCSATEQSAWEGPVSVHIGYCTPAPTSVDNDGITNVTFGTGDYIVNNDTPKATYADYSSQIGAVQAGVEATIAITFNTHYTYNTYVWVDLDNSLSFDADEVVCYGESASTYPTTLTLNFTIPANQTLGDFRMRIGSADSGLGSDPTAADPCYSSSYACFQDYTLRVLEAPSCMIPTGLTVTTDGATAIATWEGTATDYNISINGEVINNVTSPYEFRVELSTDYSVMVEANCPGETSGYCAPFNFTTPDCVGGHTIEYNLADSYGDGWNGAAINIIDENCQVQTLTVTAYSNSGTLTLCGNYYQFVWQSGNYDSECSFTFTEGGVTLFTKPSSLSDGQVLYTIGDYAYERPTDLNAEVTTTTATLTWTDNAAEAWQICLNGDEANLIDAARTNYTMENLTPATEYTVKVRATGAEGTSAWSCPITFTTEALCPAPTNVAVSDVEPFGATVSWEGDATSYNLIVREARGFSYDFESATPFEVDNFAPCTTYDGDGGPTWGVTDMDFENSNYVGAFIAFQNGLSDNFAAHSGEMFGICFDAQTASAPNNDFFILPELTIESGYIFSFWARSCNDSYGLEQFKVGIYGGNGTLSAYLAGDNTNAIQAPTTWTLYSYDLSAYVGETIQLAINCVSNDVFCFYIDDIYVGNPNPYADDEIIANATSPYALTLNPGTAYEVLVQSDCGESGVSTWVLASFATPSNCAAPSAMSTSNIEYNGATLSWDGYQDSYNIRYREAAHRETLYFNSFNTDEEKAVWTYNGSWIYGLADPFYNVPADENFFPALGWATTEEQVIISPELPEFEAGSIVAFYQRVYAYANTFQVGFSSTTNDLSAFTWGDPIDAAASFTYHSIELPEGAKYVAFKATAASQYYCVFIDNFGIYGPEIAAGEWSDPITNQTSPYTLTGLNDDVEYEWQVQGNNPDCEGGVTAWSESVFFTTTSTCTLIDELAVNSVTMNSATVSWTGLSESYNVRYRTSFDYDVVFSEDFAEGELGDWTTEGLAENSGVDEGYFMFYTSGATEAQYLISPELEGLASNSLLQFTWEVYESNPETFMVGFSSTDNAVSSFEWSSYTTSGEADYYQALVPDGTKYFAIQCPTTGYYLVVYDFLVVTNMTAAGEWVEFDGVTSPYTFEGLEPETWYDWQVQGAGCDNWFSGEEFQTEGEVAGQTLNLGAGYNWVSLSVEVEDPIEMLDQVKAALGDKGITIEGNGVGTENFGDGEWFGDLDYEGMYNEQMYLIQVSEDCTVELAGTPIVDPTLHVIDIYPGYNWIGFPYSEELDVNEALMGFEALDEDMIESPEGISYYFGEWMGDVMTLVPGQGYLYFSNSEDVKTMTIQTAGKSGRLVKLAKKPVKSTMVDKVVPAKANLGIKTKK